jgi:hypothetical protein
LLAAMARSQVSAILVSVTLSTVLWTRAGQAQDARLEWLRHNAIVVRSIHPNDTNFVDLAPLIERIGRARIVLLGEQTHADGATFLAKTRIIRFLHERMGFGVLAWEASLFAREQMETAPSESGTMATRLRSLPVPNLSTAVRRMRPAGLWSWRALISRVPGATTASD